MQYTGCSATGTNAQQFSWRTSQKNKHRTFQCFYLDKWCRQEATRDYREQESGFGSKEEQDKTPGKRIF